DRRSVLRGLKLGEPFRAGHAISRRLRIHLATHYKAPYPCREAMKMATPLRRSDFNSRNTGFTDVARSVTKVSAVILSADVAGLGMARSLGISGVPVILVDLDSRLPGMHSRHVQSFLVNALSGPALIDGLMALRRRLDHRPILFLRSDVQVHSVSQ